MKFFMISLHFLKLRPGEFAFILLLIENISWIESKFLMTNLRNQSVYISFTFCSEKLVFLRGRVLLFFGKHDAVNDSLSLIGNDTE